MRILRIVLVFFLVASLAVGAMLYGVQTPPGTRMISALLTSRIQKTAAGTRVELEKLKLHWPSELTVERTAWKDAAGTPVLTLGSVRLSLSRFRFPPGNTLWKAKTQLIRADLAALDRVVGKGQWKSDGFLHGEVRFFGKGGRLQDMELDLQSEEPGGNLNSELLVRLAEMMPPGDARGMLLRALGAKATFHFDTALLELRTDGEDYLLNLLLNGDHLLDLKIRVPKNSVALLKEMKLWK